MRLAKIGPPVYSLVAAVSVLAGCFSSDQDLILANVSVIDIVQGSVRAGQTLEIEDGRIVRIHDAGSQPRADAVDVVDGHGGYAIPGLWDMHVHALWDDAVAASFLPAFVRSGVTGIRDMGGSLEVLEKVRDAHDPQWPRIVAAGSILDGPEPVDPSISKAIDNATEARWTVARLKTKGADFIKVYTLLPREAFFAAAEAAAENGLPLVGHVPATVTPSEAIAAGLASLEHLRDELGGLCADLAETECLELPAELAARGTHVTPTLASLEAKALPGYSSHPGHTDIDHLPPVVRNYWYASRTGQQQRGAQYFVEKRAQLHRHRAMLQRLRTAGVPFLTGTDTGNPFILPGVSLHRELELFVAAGFSPREALFAATLGAARFLGIDNAGELRAGAVADVVVLDQNPLDDISNVREIAIVIRAGRLIDLSPPATP